jgi:phenylacetaldehyde dehydrogenase
VASSQAGLVRITRQQPSHQGPVRSPVDAAVANDSQYGLGAGIWTRDIAKAHALAKKIRAGTIWINCYNVFDAALPFGGYKQSGWGREMGHEALNAYTEVKAVTAQL